MSFDCSNTIITDHLAINIDLNDSNSWNYNTGFTVTSLSKWNESKSDDLVLPDFGLTAYDNGRLNNMTSGLTLTRNNNQLNLYRVGNNNASGQTSFSGYTITQFTGTSLGNYFYLNGGYLQGFFKLEGYDYEVFPPRYNKGITIETLVEILSNSEGIFFLIGTRAEDKYNSYFSGETTITGQTLFKDSLIKINNPNYKYRFSGITTSENHYLDSFNEKIITEQAFRRPENKNVIVDANVFQVDNIKNNIISFEITSDKRISYKYIDENGLLVQNFSPNIITKIGWTMIDIVFTPYDEINNFDSKTYSCYPNRLGNLIFYINGRLFWKIENFNEWYSKPLQNNREKQLGVPFNISWGGGSFGLQNSWHFNGNKINLLVQDTRKNNLLIQKYFNNSYIGNIQKLRIYDIALTPDKILHNTLNLIKNNKNYNILVNKGGRLINQILSNSNITQQTSGSDIRKSIKYRNTDNTYKNLFDMLDIKVVVKSKSNQNVELIKFKKIAEIGWLALIFVDDFTYDFIVPDIITGSHANEVLYAEIKFQWTDSDDIDNTFDRIFIVNLTTSALLDNTIKNY